MDSSSLRKRAILVTVAALAAMLALGQVGYRLYLAERPVPPAPDAGAIATGAPLTDRLVVVVVDALREDAAFDATVMPTFARIAGSGASGVSVTPPMTLTTMSVLNMGTGMTPSISWSLKNFDAEPFEDESLLSLLHGRGKHIALLGDASWSQLFGADAERQIAIHDKGFYKGADADIIASDTEVFDEAERLLADPQWDVIIVHVVGTDKAAHRHGAHRREDDGTLSMYGRRCAAIDARIARLYDRFGDRGTWLLTADHGATLAGNHGGGEEEARRAPFALAGPGIVAQRNVEQPLNALAPTLAALFGIRPPRTAEVGATFSLLTLTPDAQAHQAIAQLLARQHYAVAALALAGVDIELPKEGSADAARRAWDAGQPRQAVVMASNGLGLLQTLLSAADQGRGGLRAFGMGLGLLLMVGLLWLLTREAGAPDPLRPALVWAAVAWALLAFGAWQFTGVWLLGELFRSWGHLAWHGPLLLGALAALSVAVWGVRRSRALMDARPEWLAWAVVVLFLGQSIMRWPYGPLAETWATLLVFALGLVAWGQRRNGRALARVALAGALLVALHVLSPLLMPGADARLEDTRTTTLIADVGLAAAVLLLAARSLRKGPRAPWLALFALVPAAMAVHTSGNAWVLKTVLPALVIPSLLLPRSAPAHVRRDLLIGTALLLYRALSMDARVILLLPLAGAAVALSGLVGRRRGSVPLAAVLVLLVWQSYFLASGHAWSFSAIDVTVAFAATRDAINLGEGFALILLQHLAPWLVLVGAAVHQRVASDDLPSVRPLAVALGGMFVVHGFGAFASFEYELDNHWFTMHAVPLFVFALCNALLVGVALLAASTLLPSRRWTSAAVALLVALSGCAGDEGATPATAVDASGSDTTEADALDAGSTDGHALSDGAGATAGTGSDAPAPADTASGDAGDSAGADADTTADGADATEPCGVGSVKGLPCEGPGLEGAAVRVEALGCDGVETLAETTTDDAGAFLLAGVPSGAQRVFVSTTAGTTSFTTYIHPNSTTILTAKMTGTCADAAPAAAPCPVGSILGSVCPPGGTTIAAGGTHIEVLAPDCPAAQATIETNAAITGDFSLKDVPAGVRVLRVTTPTSVEPWLHTVFVSPGEVAHIGSIGAIACGGVDALPSETEGATAPETPDDILCTDPKWNLCGKDILSYCADPTPPFPDCNGDGIPDPCPQCPPIEVVFVLDTSGSMDDEIDALCGTIAETTAKLTAANVGATAHVYGIADTWASCTKQSVIETLGATIPDPPEGFLPIGYCGDGTEDWAGAAAVVAVHHPWQVGALRLVVPISDEGSACGDPVNDEDVRAVTAAIAVANANGVVVSPIAGTDSTEEVLALGQSLAAGTGGQWSQSEDPSLDIANSVVLSVLKACTKVNDCNENGLPDSCDLFSGAATDLDDNGVPDSCQ